MTDKRIVDALRQGPPDEGHYQPAGRALYDAGRVLPASRPRAAAGPAVIGWAATLAILLVVGVSVLRSVGPGPVASSVSTPAGPSPSPAATVAAESVTPTTPPSLVSLVKAAGELRIRIALPGPDVSPARLTFQRAVGLEVARRLGVRAVFDGVPVADLLGPSEASPTWDVVMAQRALVAFTHRFGRFAESDPYLYAEHFVVVRSDSTVSSLDQLADHGICVSDAAHSLDWALNRLALPPIAAFQRAPANLLPVIAVDDDACLARLRSGHVDAVLTQGLSPNELAAVISGDPGLKMLHGSVYTEGLGLGIAAAGASDADVAVFSSIIEAMRSDGTLGRLARQAFDGQDLSSLQP